jgi:hypothetical protein
MKVSIHYYILLLGENTGRLFEGFRDMLIEIVDGNFPVNGKMYQSYPEESLPTEAHLKLLYKKIETSYSKFWLQDPLKLVLIGEKRNRTIFKSVSTHTKDIIGAVEGDYSNTSKHDLGQIVWPVVREVLSGNREKALQELKEASTVQKVASGIDEVWRSANSEMASALLVEDDYRVKGNILKTNGAHIIYENADIMEVFDDVIDSTIEKVLAMDGTVVFLDNGSLTEHQRIALIHS